MNKKKFFLFFFSLSFLFLNSLSAEYTYFLSIAAVFKDEAPFFKEWIEYHKLLGVEHFRLYNNGSTDHYHEVLAPYIQKGEVTLIDWPSDPLQVKEVGWVTATQLPVCRDAIKSFRGLSKWLAIIDIDEFILPLEWDDIPSFLANYEQEAGVLLNWQNFGTSGLWDIPEHQLLIESLTWKTVEQSRYNQPVKSIIKPDKVNITKQSWCPHVWPYISSTYQHISPNFRPWKMGKIEVSKARINHYVLRTLSYFYQYKVPKKEHMVGHKLSEEKISSWLSESDAVEDTEILRFVPELKKKVFSNNFP